ncbi:DUF6000 family protein [Streptomyces sp. NPDC058157]|uniref:DUF6000 family protein n=1 Tax=Streptomyces sp. NPDC058157 TaxID=3346360 RepID=UPI0036E449A5
MTSLSFEDIGYRVLFGRYVMRIDSDHPRYGELNRGRIVRPGRFYAGRFARALIEDATAITDPELEALLDHGWRQRLTAAWLIGVDRRTSFRERLAGLLLDSETCYAGAGYCFALARFGTDADAGILAAYLDRYLPRTDLVYDQPEALGALLRLDARLGGDRAARFTGTDGLWERWVRARSYPVDHPYANPGELRRWMDRECDFVDAWSRPG